MQGFLATLLLLLIGPLGTSSNLQTDSTETHIWKISSIEETSCEAPGNKPALAYQLTFNLTPENVNDTVCASLDDLLTLCQILKIDNCPKSVSKDFPLIGKKYADKSGKLPNYTLTRQLFLLRHPNYKPAADDDILNRTQEALAQLHCPDFSDQDPAAVDRIFHDTYKDKLFPNNKFEPPTTTWVDSFVQGIQKSGKVKARVANEKISFFSPLEIEVIGSGKKILVKMQNHAMDPSYACEETPQH